MKICLAGRFGFFQDRLPVSSESVTVVLEKEGVLTLMNETGVYRFPTEKGKVTVPVGTWAEGENRMVFRAGETLYHLESLVRKGKTLTPGGFDVMSVAAVLHKEEAALSVRVGQLALRIAKLEERMEGSRLF